MNLGERGFNAFVPFENVYRESVQRPSPAFAKVGELRERVGSTRRCMLVTTARPLRRDMRRREVQREKPDDVLKNRRAKVVMPMV